MESYLVDGFLLHPNYWNDRSSGSNEPTLTDVTSRLAHCLQKATTKIRGWVCVSLPDGSATADNFDHFDFRQCTRRLAKFITHARVFSNVCFLEPKPTVEDPLRVVPMKTAFTLKLLCLLVDSTASYPVREKGVDTDLCPTARISNVLSRHFDEDEGRDQCVRVDICQEFFGSSNPKPTVRDFYRFINEQFTGGIYESGVSIRSTQATYFFDGATPVYSPRKGWLRFDYTASPLSLARLMTAVHESHLLGKVIFMYKVHEMGDRDYYSQPTRQETTANGGPLTYGELASAILSALPKGCTFAQVIARDAYSLLFAIDASACPAYDGETALARRFSENGLLLYNGETRQMVRYSAQWAQPQSHSSRETPLDVYRQELSDKEVLALVPRYLSTTTVRYVAALAGDYEEFRPVNRHDPFAVAHRGYIVSYKRLESAGLARHLDLEGIVFRHPCDSLKDKAASLLRKHSTMTGDDVCDTLVHLGKRYGSAARISSISAEHSAFVAPETAHSGNSERDSEYATSVSGSEGEEDEEVEEGEEDEEGEEGEEEEEGEEFEGSSESSEDIIIPVQPAAGVQRGRKETARAPPEVAEPAPEVPLAESHSLRKHSSQTTAVAHRGKAKTTKDTEEEEEPWT
jgi:hypothetical protein